MTLLAPDVNDLHAPRNPLSLRGDDDHVRQLISSIKDDAVHVHLNDKHDDFTDVGALLEAAKPAFAAGAVGLVLELGIEYELTLSLGGLILYGPLPLTVIGVLLGGAIGLYGAHDANKFHQNLRDTLVCLEQDDVDGAMCILKKESSKDWIAKMTQWFLLTKEHYAFHHFFHGYCHQIKEEYQEAYFYYNKARHDAKAANRTFMRFLAQFQEIQMLHTIHNLNETTNKLVKIEEELDKTLKNITDVYPTAFFDVYAQLINTIRALSVGCSEPQLDQEKLKPVINNFLRFNDFYLLTHFSKGEGAFLSLFGQFCQGLLLGFLGNRNTRYLTEDTIEELRTVLPKTDKTTLAHKDELLTFALEKMKCVLNDLNAFKAKHAALIAEGSPTCKALDFMEAYLFEFVVHCDGKASNFKKVFEDAKRVLGINEQKAVQIRTAVAYSREVLADLKSDFGATHFSIEDWVQDTSQVSRLPLTGNTPLHLLVQMPMVPKITHDMMVAKLNQLRQYVTIGNGEENTPLKALLEDDPYQLKQDLEREYYSQKAQAYERETGHDAIEWITYYQKAADRGCKSSKERIPAQLDSPTLTAEQCFALGKLYYDGVAFSKDYQQAKRCFERAATLGWAAGYYNVGVMYRRGEGGLKNLLEASRQYTLAMENGYIDKDKLRKTHDNLLTNSTFPLSSKKSCQKAFEKVYVHRVVSDRGHNVTQSDALNQQDTESETLLHRAAKQKSLKNCARLILFGSKKEISNRNKMLPFSDLDYVEQVKITRLQNKLTALKQDLNTPVAELLVRTIKIDTGGIDLETMRGAIRELSEQLDIKPLLELAKLASLKLHDNAKRACFKSGYDSDNDDEECMTDDQALSILISAKEHDINRIFHAGPDGQMGNGCYGLYEQGGNTVYVGGGRDLGNVRGTLIHELTHFLAHEVFKNDCKPYAESCLALKNRFEEITSAMLLNIITLPNELSSIQHVFLYYDKENWHSELIVRVPQIIASNPEDGLRLLGTHVPDLLAYYREAFLPALNLHTQMLRERALSGWDEALFPQSTMPYAFDTR